MADQATQAAHWPLRAAEYDANGTSLRAPAAAVRTLADILPPGSASRDPWTMHAVDPVNPVNTARRGRLRS